MPIQLLRNGHLSQLKPIKLQNGKLITLNVLKINSEKFYLKGVIGYIGPDDSIGHFIGYCLRHNGLWEKYDDRFEKSKSCSSKKCIRIQLLFCVK